MLTITGLNAREILDSRGMPTLEVTLTTHKARAVASVPAGASTGVHEAVELRDGEARFGGKGVRKAVACIQEEIAHALVGNSFDQASLDGALCSLDGTERKSRLGANSLLGVSLAFARAAAQEQNIPLYAYFGALAGNTKFSLPRPMFNVLNGGKHADSKLSFQEFMLVPTHGVSMATCVEQAAAVIAALRVGLAERGFAVSVGDEGGFAPHLASNEEALDFVWSAIGRSGHEADFSIALDAAASSFYTDGAYALDADRVLSREALLAYYTSLCERYPIRSIEDPFAEDDWEGFHLIQADMGGRITIVGDDVLVTSVLRIAEAAEKQALNAAIIKPNQVGTVSETIAAAQAVKARGWATVASHRSGETTDTSISDLAVGLSCDFIKAGSLARGERVCKYNRLMEIESEL